MRAALLQAPPPLLAVYWHSLVSLAYRGLTRFLPVRVSTPGAQFPTGPGSLHYSHPTNPLFTDLCKNKQGQTRGREVSSILWGTLPVLPGSPPR